VGGLYGYGVAMKKHKANELLHQASMLAATISAQIQSKGELPQSIEDFGNGKYGEFKEPEKANDEQFTMQITGMDSAVCEQMETMAGGMVRQAKCNGTTLTLTYNNNLSSDKVAADYNDDEGGCKDSGRKYCSGSNSCVALDKECGCSGTNNGCQKCDTETGSLIADDEKEDENCTTADGKEGTCNAGECVETPACPEGGELIDGDCCPASKVYTENDAKKCCTAGEVVSDVCCPKGKGFYSWDEPVTADFVSDNGVCCIMGFSWQEADTGPNPEQGYFKYDPVNCACPDGSMPSPYGGLELGCCSDSNGTMLDDWGVSGVVSDAVCGCPTLSDEMGGYNSFYEGGYTNDYYCCGENGKLMVCEDGEYYEHTCSYSGDPCTIDPPNYNPEL
jgi:hypothetical protein